MNLKKYTWLAALPMIFTACQEDMLVENQPQGITTLTANMGKGAEDSRAQIVLNGTNKEKEIFHWNEGDAFTLFQKEGETEWSEHLFDIASTYSEDKPSKSADFTTSQPLTEGAKFVAFYPACTVGENRVQMTINSELPDNSRSSWETYFQENMFMKAIGTVGITSADTQIEFQQLCGIIRITYRNDSKADRTFDIIQVDGQWTIGGYCPLDKVNTFVPNVTQKGDAYGVTFQNKATVRAGQTEDFYILFLYNAVEGVEKAMSTVSIVDIENKQILKTPKYSKSLPVFKAGNCYWLNVTDNGKELFWTVDKPGGGGEVQDDVFVDVSTYAELKKALAMQANRTLYIHMENDIALEGPLSISANKTVIEMDGYTLLLAENYTPKDMSAVFEVLGNVNFVYGNLQGKDGSKLHDYYFNLNGTHASLNFSGVYLQTGTAIENAIFMDDDRITLNPFTVNGEPYDNVITTLGDAIRFVGNAVNPIYVSYINGDVTGNVNVSTTYESLNAEFIFQTGTINGNLNTSGVNSNITVSQHIRKADAVTIGTGYTGWDQAGRFVQNQNYTVSTFAELKTAIETAQISNEMTNITLSDHIILESPLILKKPASIRGNYSLTVSDNFDWSSGADAAIVVEGKDPEKNRLNLGELSLYGSQTAASGKYLLKSTKSNLDLNNVVVIGNGVTNAVSLTDANLQIEGTSSIKVGAVGYAMNLLAQNRYVQAVVNTSRAITGNVGFTAYHKDEVYPNVVGIRTGIINGNFSTAGTYADEVAVHVEEGAVINGTGWNEAAIALMQNDFKNHGDTYVQSLTLADNQVVTLTVGTTHEGMVHFGAESLNGSGTIKFVNDSKDKVIVDVDVQQLGDGVNFEFEGNIQKRIRVNTTRVKEFFEMGKASDHIIVFLSSDVTLTEQILIGADRVWKENDDMGITVLEFNNYTVNIKLDKPAFVVQGGLFDMSGGPINSVGSTINARSEFIQIGAGGNADNNRVECSIMENITVRCDTDSWIGVQAVEENLTSHKDICVFINGQPLSEELKKKVRVAEGYSGSVMLNGIEINNDIIIAKDEYLIEAVGGDLNLEVKTIVDFMVKTSVDWIKQKTGSEAKTLSFTIDENTSDESREGLIIITSGDLKQTIKVVQKGASNIGTGTGAELEPGGGIEEG